MEKIMIGIIQYEFDLREEQSEYNDLHIYLKNRGLKMFDAFGGTHMENRNTLNKIPSVIEIDTSYLFDNQYNTIGDGDNNGLRVFEWREFTPYPNQATYYIKGYYFKEGPGLDSLRKLQSEKVSCGYCGKQYLPSEAPNHGWCTSCTGSEYLDEDTYGHLKLYPISAKRKYKQDIPKWLVDMIENRQKAKAIIKEKKDLKDTIAKIKKSLIDAQIEHDGKMWLIDRGIKVNNVIYYSHTNVFCFGWRDSLKLDEKKSTELKNKLIEFPFEWDIK